MIRLLKGYARKSILLREFYDSINSDQKVILNCTDDGVNVFADCNVCNLLDERIEYVLTELRKHWFRYVFIYTHAREDEALEIVESLRDFTEDFQTIMLTIQTDVSYSNAFGNKFEIVELR